jgi:hypothetical protein
MFISGVLILKHFLLGGFPQWPVDVIRVTQLPQGPSCSRLRYRSLLLHAHWAFQKSFLFVSFGK